MQQYELWVLSYLYALLLQSSSFYETLFPQPSRKHGIKDITLSLARLYTCCIYINFCLLCTYGDTKFVNGDHGDQFSWDIWSRRITSGRVNSCVFSHSCTNCPCQKNVWLHVTQPLILHVSHSSTAYCVLYSTHGVMYASVAAFCERVKSKIRVGQRVKGPGQIG